MLIIFEAVDLMTLCKCGPALIMQKIELNVIQLNCMGWRDEQIGWHGSSEDKQGTACGDHDADAAGRVAWLALLPDD